MTLPEAETITLDLRGLQNPEPILRVAVESSAWRAGDTVQVLADDESFANDFLRWCVGCDLDLLELRYLPSGVTELKLRKPGRAA